MKRGEKWAALRLSLQWTYRASPFLTIVVLLLTVAAGLLAIVEPYVFKLVLDAVIASRNLETAAIGFVGLIIVYGAARTIQNVFWDATNVIRRLFTLKLEQYGIHELMKRISGLDMVYFEDPAYYNTLDQATRSMWRMLEFFWSITFFISEFIAILVIVSALMFYDWRLILLICVGSLPSIYFSMKWAELLWSAFNEASPIQRHAQYYRVMLTEQPEAIREIKAFGLQEHFLHRFRCLFKAFISKQDKAALTQLRWYGLISLVEGGVTVVISWLVIQSFLRGNLTVGDLTFLWSILFQFAGHARWVVRLIGDIHTHASFITSIVKVMDFKPTMVQASKPKRFPKKIQKGIELRDVSFMYGRKQKALSHINLTVKPNENIAIVGENGSGKTTLIKLLCRLYDPADGEILIDGIPLRAFAFKDLYKNIGVIFQDFMKYEALIEENIRYGKLSEKSHAKLHEAAVRAGAWSFIKGLEQKYKTHVGKRLKDEGLDLSVGQWQKIAMARAFFRDAPILVLDEPTAAVDAKAEYQLFQRFRQLTKNKITFLISHRFSTVRMADRIIVMDKGRITESGTHDELMQQNGQYAKLFKLQAKGYA